MIQEPSVPLLIKIVTFTRLPARWMTATIAIILLLIFVIFSSLDGSLSGFIEDDLWRYFMDAPVLITYILLVYPFMYRLWTKSVQTLYELMSEKSGDRDKPNLYIPDPKRRWEIISFVGGAVFWLCLWQPWTWVDRWQSGSAWLSVYDVVTQCMLFGLLVMVIYSSFVGHMYQNGLLKRRLILNIFNTSTLTPVARSSLGLSITFIGGISLSLIFQNQEDLLKWNNIFVWAILLCFAILVFFLSLWSTHSAMSDAKKRELSFVRNQLKITSAELKEKAEDSTRRGTDELSPTITALLNYERRITEVPEWPFNAGILRRLTVSILAPVVVFLVKVFSGIGFRL
ncbi:MAG: hypothetical protein JSU79_06990 [Dehalococcoidales bacterium]|nr:MAG: hypothetical protein JSU79_06990 [Dehalococcoidales bacterium]